MSRPTLVQLTHHRLSADYRLPLLRAAARQEGMAVHIQCGADSTVSLLTDGSCVTATRWNGRADLRRVLERAHVNVKEAIVLTGVGGAWAPRVMDVARLFPRRSRFYDVQDDLRYGAQGRDYVKFIVRDLVWRALCPNTIILECGMRLHYPKAAFLDNASDVTLVNGRRDADRLVYVGSIDQRLDFDLLESILAVRPVDIWGGFHGSAGAAHERLEALAARSPALRLLGPYNNDNLSSILSGYQIGIVPYIADHPLTRHINPDKVYHYLNAGLRVASSAFPQARRMAQWLTLLTSGSDALAVLKTGSLKRPVDWPYETYSWARRWEELVCIASQA